MLFRKPFPPWICISLFLASVALVPLISRSLRRPIAPPRTLAEIAEFLSQNAPDLYVVPSIENRPECGLYICMHRQPREQLVRLVRNPKVVGTSRLGEWQGIVFLDRLGNLDSLAEELQIWGEHGLQIGPYVFFGDPNLLQRIYKVILGTIAPERHPSHLETRSYSLGMSAYTLRIAVTMSLTSRGLNLGSRATPA
jgi:hypothetical protein